jgi:hypothetical protein
MFNMEIFAHFPHQLLKTTPKYVYSKIPVVSGCAQYMLFCLHSNKILRNQYTRDSLNVTFCLESGRVLSLECA